MTFGKREGGEKGGTTQPQGQDRGTIEVTGQELGRRCQANAELRSAVLRWKELDHAHEEAAGAGQGTTSSPQMDAALAEVNALLAVEKTPLKYTFVATPAVLRGVLNSEE